MPVILKAVCLSAVLLFGAVVHAKETHCARQVFKSMEQLSHTVEQGEFKLWYATQGKHALPDTQDLNGNGVPDRMDDLLLQLQAARDFYSDVLHLTPPLHQPRYNQAHTINVYVLAMRKGNGLAFHEPVQSRPSRKADSEPCGLRIYVNNQLDPSRNLTPAHELFHLYQYGYAMFKRPWYLEGMARLMETAFAGPERLQRYQQVSSGPVSCQDVVGESYSAVRFWWEQQDADAIEIPASLNRLRYTDGTPVFTNQSFKHGEMVKRVLEELGDLSRNTAQSMDLPSYRWPVREQGSKDFDAPMCQALAKVLH